MPSANERPRGTVNMTHSQVQKLKSQGNLWYNAMLRALRNCGGGGRNGTNSRVQLAKYLTSKGKKYDQATE
jgi:hypothetical protein